MATFREAFSQIKTFPSSFWTLISAILINQMGNAAFVFLVLYLTQHLHFTLVQSSYAFATLGLTMLVIGLFGGGLVDRFGGARMMTIVLVLNGLILMSFPLLQHFFSVIGVCILWGITLGLYRPAAQTFVSLLTPSSMHKLAFSIYRLAINLGMSIGPAVGGYLATHSFAAIFIANGVSNIIASIILFLGFRGTIYLGKNKTHTAQPFELSIKWIKQDKLLRWFVIGIIPVSMVFFQHSSTMAVFLGQHLHFAPSFYGLLFTLNTLMIVFLELPLNIVTLAWPYRANFILGSVFMTLGFSGFLFASEKWHILALTATWTLGEMILFPTTSTYIASLAPEGRRGSYISIYGTCATMGMSFGPWLGGIIMSELSTQSLWIGCAIGGILSILVFSLMPMPKTTTHNHM